MATTTKAGAKAATKAAPAAPRGAKARANAATRNSHGRFKPDHRVRNAAFAATAVVGVAAAGIAAAFKFGLLDRFLPELEGNSAEDLLIDGDLRPDPYADEEGIVHAEDLQRDPNVDIAIGARDARPFSGTSTVEEQDLVKRG